MTALAKPFATLRVVAWSGKQIRNPGIYSGIPLDTYHAGNICVEPSISSTGLRKIYNPSPFAQSSPAHYWAESPYNPVRVEDEGEESRSMILGRAAHHLLFGEKDFQSKFALTPATVNGVPWSGNAKQCKLWLKEQRDLGITVISKTQLKAIVRIAEELAKEPMVQNGLLNGLIEHSIFWKHRTGIWLKSRPDALPNESLDFVDLKLTQSVMWPAMQAAIREYGYYMQAGLTAMGIKAVLGVPMNSLTYVFVESTEPHCIEIVTLKESEIARGIEACEIAIARFNTCWTQKRWPGPRGDRADARYIEMSEIDRKRVDDQIALDRKAI